MRNTQKVKQLKRYRRKVRSRAKIFGTRERPRLCVSRSLKHISAQLINDEKGQTILSASDLEIPRGEKAGKSKTERALLVGRLIAEKAVKKNIQQAVFDRSGKRYHGRLKALADGAREKGLTF